MPSIQKDAKAAFFGEALLGWHAVTPRDLPWKTTRDPYKIWLSEIILQQTRVEQGLPYYNRFVEHYPTVEALANANEDEVLKDWEGLGYYSRARNLHLTAKYITTELNGVFPNDYKSILALKGVGPYTAAAIASFAFDLPHAVVDGNVYRVLSRFFGIATPIDSTKGKKEFAELAQKLLAKHPPAIYNQAIMNFGAICCVPKSPDCKKCPMHSQCTAFNEHAVEKYPVKEKKLVKKIRYFQYFHFQYENFTLIEKRDSKDIWKGLYQFPLLETERAIDRQLLEQNEDWKTLVGGTTYEITKLSKPFKQTLTHQYIIASFWKIKLHHLPTELLQQYVKVSEIEMKRFAYPKVIDRYINDTSLKLNLM